MRLGRGIIIMAWDNRLIMPLKQGYGVFTYSQKCPDDSRKRGTIPFLPNSRGLEIVGAFPTTLEIPCFIGRKPMPNGYLVEWFDKSNHTYQNVFFPSLATAQRYGEAISSCIDVEDVNILTAD